MFGFTVIDFELIGQILQQLWDLGRLFRTQVDTDGRSTDRNKQTQSEQFRTSFP